MTVIKYPGSKKSIAKWIIQHFPYDYTTMTYFEPFFGSGGVFFAKERSKIETINDLDGEITNMFIQIREKPEELMMLLMNTPWSRDEYYLSFENSGNPLEQARRCIVKFWFNIGAEIRGNKRMRSVIEGNTGSIKSFHSKLPDVITQATERLKHDKKCLVQIENRNVFELLPIYNRENVLMYLDPPYLPKTRKSRKMYKFEFTDADHEKLLKEICCSKAKILISGYENELYAKYLSNWRKDNISAKNQTGKLKTETIWMNYPASQSCLFTKESSHVG